MPFIRYELGDAVTQGSEACACGAPFSTLLKIRGRELDYFVKKNGQLFHPYILSDALKPGAFRWLGKYRIVQESLTQVRLTAEARPKPTREDITATIDAARRVLGDDVHFIIDIVDELQHDPSGKYRIYQSKVSRN
jgi:phenylacetate-coenzyme A ligase PaaK-like adenylate-forming protein